MGVKTHVVSGVTFEYYCFHRGKYCRNAAYDHVSYDEVVRYERFFEGYAVSFFINGVPDKEDYEYHCAAGEDHDAIVGDIADSEEFVVLPFGVRYVDVAFVKDEGQDDKQQE